MILYYIDPNHINDTSVLPVAQKWKTKHFSSLSGPCFDQGSHYNLPMSLDSAWRRPDAAG